MLPRPGMTQAMLRIYVSAHCHGCATALRLADRMRAARPDLPLAVVDVDESGVRVPASVIGTPLYTWNDHVLFRGNPSETELLARLTDHDTDLR
jgi:hypothetical protein